MKSYTTVVSTRDGRSDFEDAELDLDEQQVSDGTPAMFVGWLASANGVAFVRFAAFDSEPHPAAGPQCVVVLRGVIEVQVGDGALDGSGPATSCSRPTRPAAGTSRPPPATGRSRR